ncbi:MAG: HYExAFE family protein [Phycisphaeraceae bacterium]|nr:HYExAFE family protein [Phycisphaeraceae bacterium]
MIRHSVHPHERVFEHFLRARRVPCVGIDEARKALLPETAPALDSRAQVAGRLPPALKSFDFLVYTRPHNLLIEVKGRSAGSLARADASRRSTRPARLESWVTHDDLDSLRAWEALFGPSFRAAIAFVYPLAQQPPDSLFQEIVPFRDDWYALLVVPADAYAERMRPRSQRWGTVDLATADLLDLAMPIPLPQRPLARVG